MVRFVYEENQFSSTSDELKNLILNHILGKKNLNIRTIISDSSRRVDTFNKSKFLENLQGHFDKVLSIPITGENGILNMANIERAKLEKSRVMDMEIENEKVRDFTIDDLFIPKKKALVVGMVSPEDVWTEKEAKLPSDYSLREWREDEPVPKYEIENFGDKEAGDTMYTKIVNSMLSKDGLKIQRAGLKDDDKDYMFLTGDIKIEYEIDFGGEKKRHLERRFTNVSLSETRSRPERMILFNNKEKDIEAEEIDVGQEQHWNVGEGPAFLIKLNGLIEGNRLATFDKKEAMNRIRGQIEEMATSNFIIEQMVGWHSHPLEVVSFYLIFEFTKSKIIGVDEANENMPHFQKDTSGNIIDSTPIFKELPYKMELKYNKVGTFRISPYAPVKQKGTLEERVEVVEGPKGEKEGRYELLSSEKQYAYNANLDKGIKKIMRKVNSIKNMIEDAEMEED